VTIIRILPVWDGTQCVYRTPPIWVLTTPREKQTYYEMIPFGNLKFRMVSAWIVPVMPTVDVIEGIGTFRE